MIAINAPLIIGHILLFFFENKMSGDLLVMICTRPEKPTRKHITLNTKLVILNGAIISSLELIIAKTTKMSIANPIGVNTSKYILILSSEYLTVLKYVIYFLSLTEISKFCTN